MFNPWKANSNKIPGLSHHSKVIKKKKKPVLVVEEEGEEGAELSDQVMQEDEERAPSALLDEFEKFPEFLEIELKPHGDLSMLSESNKFALEKLLD